MLRENAILWLLGIYVEIFEREVVLGGHKIDVGTMKGIFFQKKLQSCHQALPELGILLGIDFDTDGVG